MMKFFGRSLLAVLISTFCFLVSCSENDDPVVEEQDRIIMLSVSSTTFDFGSEGGTESFEITSNSTWKILYDNTLWARPSIQTTKGDAAVVVTADKNESVEARAMSLTISSEGVDDITITVNQEGREPDPEAPEEPDFIEPEDAGMRNITSIRLAEEMGIGWNLGNSLEAINVSGDGGYSGSEVSWGNPAVNKPLIDAVKAAGFSTIRIPVSWSHMFEDEETYDISYEWKLRVEEVVNYVLNNDMYAIINIHWDGGWMNHPDYENQEEINQKLKALWKQIAVYFRDYDDHLLFAGTNEVHVENDYGAPSAENADVQNSFNQTFIDAVRATGGRNTYRHLIVQSYNTNISHGVNYMEIPEDETEHRLMVEVHFYDPYQFTLQETDGAAIWGEAYQNHPAHSGWGDEDWVDEAFGQVKTTFVDNGYPVILGEYGAILRADPNGVSYENHVETRNDYLYYVTKAAIDNGMVPIYWDNGHTGNYGFGLFNRSTGEVMHPDAVEAIISVNE